MRILSINASPHGSASHGHSLVREVEQRLSKNASSSVEVISRDLTADPLPPVSIEYARAITSRTPDPAMFETSERLIAELESTDVLVINTPIHNFTVPAALKLWIDHVLRIHRTFRSTPEGKVGLMRDRPTIVIVGSGGFHFGEHASQPDFLTPYLRYALGSIGITTVQFLPLQGLVRGEDAVKHALDGARAELEAHSLFSSVKPS
ncbi:FMN-dependent NADH-azoreductase [Trinickia acidisoli]|uniref:FMN-dependent NADH-azoreductase n=1 Tax=Trinickia acidisoli TaxID=2767482 RepID=UPI001A90459B|nr:NAD(P)H-dependent oxidoreductase [Trinickia acidisoli]